VKVAVVDIGSNTTKVLVAQKNSHGLLCSVAQKSLPCRLATGLGKGDSILSTKALEQTLEVIDELLHFSKNFSPDLIKIVETEALRLLKNADVLIESIRNRFGFSADIISGSEEASLIARGLMTDPAVSSLNEFFAIDLGGGSLEIMKVIKGQPVNIKSLPLGAVVLAEKFLDDLSVEPAPTNIFALQNYVTTVLGDNVFPNTSKHVQLVGTGGAIIFLRQLICSNKNIEFLEHPKLNFSDIDKLAFQINSMNLFERISQFNELPRDRADVFPAALIVILELMKFLKLAKLTHSFHNLRYGLADQLLNDI
jgi:exopolyphosphatase/guanosine-5'-triphosphate,3'-diphosphate pyrophosphatase